MGRKDHWIAASDAGGKRAAVLHSYSLIGAAKLNGINLQAHLLDALTRIADCRIDHIDELSLLNLVRESA